MEWLARVLKKFDNCLGNQTQIRLALQTVYKSQSQILKLSDGLIWADGFQFPPDVYKRDAERLRRASNSIQVMSGMLHKERANDRFSKARVHDCIPQDYEEYDLLLDLAEGVRVFTDMEFQPNSLTRSAPPPLSKSYVEAAPIVNKLIYELWVADLLFLLPTKLIWTLKTHYSLYQWAPQRKIQGRQLVNPSNLRTGAINSSTVSQKSEDFYHKIHLVTIVELAQMILRFEESKQREMGASFNIRDVVLMKNDLQRAFMLLNFRPDSVHLLAAELTNGLSVLHHTGLFGLGTMPYAFAVISRALEQHLNHAPPSFKQMSGETKVYVDDAMTVTMASDLDSDNQALQKYCCALLGPNAIALNKYESGRQVVLIGWNVDLNTRMITLSTNNFNKFAYALFNIDLDRHVQVTTLEKLASLGSRYSLIIPEMKILNSAIYRNYAGMTNRNAFIAWHDDTIVTMWIWRTLIINLHFNEKTAAKPLDSFRITEPQILITFDASLSGIGAIIRKYVGKDCNGDIIWGEIIKMGSVKYNDLHQPIQFGDDSSFQNLSEFIAVVFALLMLRCLNIPPVGIVLQGDSITALRWSETHRFRGILSNPAALVYLNICTHHGYEINLVDYIDSNSNYQCDSLSRDCKPEELCKSLSCSTDCIWHVDDNSNHILSLCGPNIPFNDLSYLLTFWGTIAQLVTKQQ